MNHKKILKQVRSNFPMLKAKMNGTSLVYADNAATSLKPKEVLDAMEDYYKTYGCNIHRGVYELSQRATDAYEQSRDLAAEFLNAPSSKNIVFTSGATEAINLVAHSFGACSIEEGDEIIVSEAEHHANLVPWVELCKQKGATLKVIMLNDDGSLDMESFQGLISEKTKLVSVIHVSNSLGTINPVDEIIEIAHEHHIPVLIDGSQAAPHMEVNVEALDADFYVFTGHKIGGPTGTGVLYAKEEFLEDMPPFHTGGDMINVVTFDEVTYAEHPHKFEAGTPNIAGVIGLGKAISFLMALRQEHPTFIGDQEAELTSYLHEQLALLPVSIIGTADHKIPVASIVMEGVHPHDVGSFLDSKGVAVRAGHHCTQPVMRRYHVPATTRISLSYYNTKEEIDQIIAALKEAITLFA